MIINEKQLMAAVAAPPAYCPNEVPPPFSPSGGRREIPLNLSTLPAHILLLIIYHTFPQSDAIDESKAERQRKTLYWLSTSLRLVCRNFYTACSHILRSTYLPAYDGMIRPPYSSDPFPLPSTSTPSYSSPQSTQSPLDMLQRETQVFDLFIALKVREDVWADDSEFHLEREESFKDLFDLNQPRARLEDLVRHYGVREGIIGLVASPPASPIHSGDFSPTGSVFRPSPTPSGSRSAQKRAQHHSHQLSFSTLSVSFSSRTVGVILTTGRTKRTIVQVQRESRNERLEVTAKRIVQGLKSWLDGEAM